MKWYFAIDEAGSLGQTGEDAKTAVRSAAALGQLAPHLLYHGARNGFTAWMQAHGVTVIDAEPAFLDTIRAAEAAGIYKTHSIGHWLRAVVPAIEQTDEFVLYTDCDIIFLRKVGWASIRPRILAAAPEFKRDNWNYFNSGVMVINVPAARASYLDFEALIRGRMNEPADYFSYDDQFAFNEFYRGRWDRLDPLLNYKPYWGYNEAAPILHFHGPKLGALAAIAAGDWQQDNPTAIQLARMLDAHLGHYIAWAQSLGDRLQLCDLPRAVTFNFLASALLRYGKSKEFSNIDASFMEFCMF